MITNTALELQLTATTNNLENYLHQVNTTLSHLDRDLYTHHSSDLAQLKQTLVNLEVAHIKHTAISQSIWDFYPTSDHVISKMICVADIQPHHLVLEPTNSVRPTLPKATAKPSKACGCW